MITFSCFVYGQNKKTLTTANTKAAKDKIAKFNEQAANASPEDIARMSKMVGMGDLSTEDQKTAWGAAFPLLNVFEEIYLHRAENAIDPDYADRMLNQLLPKTLKASPDLMKRLLMEQGYTILFVQNCLDIIHKDEEWKAVQAQKQNVQHAAPVNQQPAPTTLQQTAAAQKQAHLKVV